MDITKDDLINRGYTEKEAKKIINKNSSKINFAIISGATKEGILSTLIVLNKM